MVYGELIVPSKRFETHPDDVLQPRDGIFDAILGEYDWLRGKYRIINRIAACCGNTHNFSDFAKWCWSGGFRHWQNQTSGRFPQSPGKLKYCRQLRFIPGEPPRSRIDERQTLHAFGDAISPRMRKRLEAFNRTEGEVFCKPKMFNELREMPLKALLDLLWQAKRQQFTSPSLRTFGRRAESFAGLCSFHFVFCKACTGQECRRKLGLWFKGKANCRNFCR